MASATPLAEDNTSQTTLPIAGQTGRPQKLDPKKTGFFDLPAELRNQIYAITLIRPRKLCLRWIGPGHPYRVRLINTRIYASVLRTCKAIYEEATPVLYGANTFLFSFDNSAWFFLDMIDRSLELVRHFENTDTVQFEAWKTVLALKPYLIPQRSFVDPFEVKLARAVQRSDPSELVMKSIFLTAPSSNRIRSEIERHCRTSEGQRKVLNLLKYDVERSESPPPPPRLWEVVYMRALRLFGFLRQRER